MPPFSLARVTHTLITPPAPPTANQDLMVRKFTKVMAKMAVLGQDPRRLTDCSEVIPVPKPAKSQVAHLPAGKTLKDIEASCKKTPFPTIKANPGECLTC